MKLKLIKNNEVVVNKEDSVFIKDQFNLINAINNGKVGYFAHYSNISAVKVTDGLSCFTIKVFKSDDPEYNRTCAEELVELLNQQQ